MPDKPVKPNSGNSPAIPENIAHYRILRRLGKGGMGEVFLGEDTRQHNRRVALKILPPELLTEERRVRRFRQEARAVLALNHPNIITIYEIGEIKGAHFIATEYIEGETLQTRLKGQSLSLKSTLEIALQVASALDAAHRAGIVHRDIKPDNVMVRHDGIVKVLDFGLVKLSATDSSEVDREGETKMQVKTRLGMIMGTVAYMSPEQARAQETDARTDILSFGCVLYEC
jgi:eukaryotic-like serine/threonine-protein kinase